jgi:hypothetical protein
MIENLTSECRRMIEQAIDRWRRYKASNSWVFLAPSFSKVERAAKLVAERGAPEFIRSDNGPEFVAREIK